jgi:hypothetical protein
LVEVVHAREKRKWKARIERGFQLRRSGEWGCPPEWGSAGDIQGGYKRADPPAGSEGLYILGRPGWPTAYQVSRCP